MKDIALVVTSSLALIAAAAGFASADRIKEIDVIENTKTTDQTVMVIAGIEVGDDWRPDMTEQVKADLVNSGLFKDADVFSQPVSGGVKVTIRAKDKHSWVIAPTVYNQPTNKGGGIGFGENNLFGENKKLLLYAQVATGDSFFIGAYVDPSIAGTRFFWQYDLFLRSERVFEYAAPKEWFDDPEQVRRSRLNYFNSGVKAGVNLMRGFALGARLRGAYLYYDDTEIVEGVCVEDVLGDPTGTGACTLPTDLTMVPDPGAEGWDVSSELSLVFDRTANWYGIFSGNKYALSLEKSLPELGSDFDYWYAAAQYVRARKYFSRHNLIIKAIAGYGDNMPFQQEWTSGGPDQRGLKNRQLRGNLRLSGTTEYSIPLVTIAGWAFRGLAFYDTSYTAFVDTDPATSQRNYLPDHERHGFAPFKNTVGLGTRLYVRQIVLPLLGLDFGYGIERREWEMYFAIGLTAF
ncbi:MAG TPA: BamA/TamA family outer membrane protein [Kofleriaceae bacterium]|nr:BamA/TamA family outer membrane protein [Kofleriaceae bacterium]